MLLFHLLTLCHLLTPLVCTVRRYVAPLSLVDEHTNLVSEPIRQIVIVRLLWIKLHTIANHEVEIHLKLLDAFILQSIELVLHLAQIHGRPNRLIVGWHGLGINGLMEGAAPIHFAYNIQEALKNNAIQFIDLIDGLQVVELQGVALQLLALSDKLHEQPGLFHVVPQSLPVDELFLELRVDACPLLAGRVPVLAGEFELTLLGLFRLLLLLALVLEAHGLEAAQHWHAVAGVALQQPVVGELVEKGLFIIKVNARDSVLKIRV